jgi:hypothetical protein
MCCTKCEFENPAGSTLRTIHMRGLGRSFWTANRIERTLHPHVEGLCGSEHRRFMSMGVWEGAAPVTLGAVARISFIRDPDGNFIEISQRASLTGPIPG